MTAEELGALTRPVLSVGVLTAELHRLGGEVAELERSGVAMIHVDVMDGHFCPGLTVGPAVVAALRSRLLIDVHLLVEDPLRYIDVFADAGASLITVHAEARGNIHRTLQRIREVGVAAGVALNPGTPVSAVDSLLDLADLVLLLAVNPGFPGQRYLPATAGRAAAVRQLLASRPRRDVLLGVDGGLTQQNAADVLTATGADVLVAGRAVFDGTPDVAANAHNLLTTLAGAA